ncbi:MAG: MmcQ/YjbR family DNA-binding protein [Bacteroidota bacterium]
MKDKTLLALTFIRNFVFTLPEVSERLSFETPAFYVQKNMFARLKEGEEELVVHTIERDKWLKQDPLTFYITPHFQNYKYMMVNLDRVEPAVLKELLLAAWTNRASKKLLKLI